MGGSINKNVLIDLKIENPWDEFYYFCSERQSIYYKKENGNLKPWTNDKILDECRFTNLFRDLDKVSKFIFNWVKPIEDDLELLIANLLYARFCNRESTMLATGFIHNIEPINFIKIIDSIGGGKTKAKVNKFPVWRGAYQVAGAFKSKLGYNYREEMLVNHIPKKAKELSKVILKHAGQVDMTIILDDLNEVWGYKNNMVFTQMLLDVGYFRPDLIIDEIEPPMLSGVEPLLLLFNETDGKILISKAKDLWNKNNPIRKMTFKDAEHSLCEFRKYICWKNNLSLKRYYKK